MRKTHASSVSPRQFLVRIGAPPLQTYALYVGMQYFNPVYLFRESLGRDAQILYGEPEFLAVVNLAIGIFGGIGICASMSSRRLESCASRGVFV